MVVRFAARMSTCNSCIRRLRVMVGGCRLSHIMRAAALGDRLIKMVGIDFLLTVNPGRTDGNSGDSDQERQKPKRLHTLLLRTGAWQWKGISGSKAGSQPRARSSTSQYLAGM